MKLPAGEFFRSAAHSLAVEPRDPQSPFPMHNHEFEELVIIESGNGWQVINDEPFFVTCGEVFYLRPGDCHEFTSLHDLRLTNILYRPNCATFNLAQGLDAEVRDNRHWQVNEDALRELRPIIEALSRETLRPDPLSKLMAETLFVQLNLILQRHRFAPANAKLPSPSRLGHLLSYLRHNCVEEVDFEELSRRFGFSVRNLTRVFRDATGVTPHDFLFKTRINRAMRALGEKTDSITEIAYDCGFNDGNYFSFCFSKLVGLTPSEYRHRAKNLGFEATPRPADDVSAPARKYLNRPLEDVHNRLAESGVN
jgi:AraC family L-rhamnose operon transcriptional activator RhaR